MATWLFSTRVSVRTVSDTAVMAVRSTHVSARTVSEVVVSPASDVRSTRVSVRTVSPATVLRQDILLTNVPYRTVVRPIRRLRQTPILTAEQARLFISSLQLDLETGVGTSTGDGATPYLALQVSRDNGHTWGPEHRIEIGAQGQYRTRAIWRRVGQARGWGFRFVTDAPVAITLLDAYINPKGGES